MDHLTRPKFIVTASLLPQVTAIKGDAKNLFDPGVDKSKARFPAYLAASVTEAVTSEEDSQAAAIDGVQQVPTDAGVPEGIGVEIGSHPTFHVHVH